MAKRILIDELHVTVFAPADLNDKEHATIHRTLKSRKLSRTLARAVHGVIGTFASLAKATVRISR